MLEEAGLSPGLFVFRARAFGPRSLESLRPSDFAPAYGSEVAASRRPDRRGAEAPLYLEAEAKQRQEQMRGFFASLRMTSHSKNNGNSKNNGKCNRRSFDFAENQGKFGVNYG